MEVGSERSRCRRRFLTGVTGLALAATVGACAGEGGNLPSVTRTGTIAVPSVSLPSRSVPPSTEGPSTPTAEPTTEEPEPTTEEPEPTTEEPEPTTEPPEPTPTPEPPTETVTATATATATPEPAPTETVTQTPTPTETVTPTPTPSPSPTDLAQGEVAADEGTPWWLWLLLGLVALGALLAAVLLPRRRRREEWAADLAADEAEATWFARELLPRLESAATPDALAGGWLVSSGRVVAAEDRLTGLASTAPDDPRRARATQLRDAVRAARLGMEELVAARAPGSAAQVALLAARLDAVLAQPGPDAPGGPNPPGGTPASGPA